MVVDGNESDLAQVQSGVPQGTVMGPLFINDLPIVVDPHTQVRMFADDCLIYRNIKNLRDQAHLQRDLNALNQWGTLWGMKLNAKKCNILTISSMAQPLSKFYEIDSTFLERVDSATYLGIIISKSLRFSSHIENTANKMNRRLGFLKRNLNGSLKATKQTAYFSLVRAGAEYGSTIWDPFLAKDKLALERVQRRAARWVEGVRPHEIVSVTDILEKLKWDTLEERRRIQRLTLMYKVVHGLVAVSPEQLHMIHADARTRALHRHKFRIQSARSEERKYSFVNRTIPEWNNLPTSTAEADSLCSFKSQLAEPSG